MAEILIRPANPFDFEPEELEELANQLREDDSSLDVRIDAQRERGYGVTPYEVIQIIATTGDAALVLGAGAKVVLRSIKWARERWQKEKDTHSSQPPRPRVIEVLDEDGHVLTKITIDLPDGDPRQEDNPKPLSYPTRIASNALTSACAVNRPADQS